jgi:isoleucyl-tRNA synthetase
MYRIQRYKHSYPHCWRCSHELIFNAVKEWFIRPMPGRVRRASVCVPAARTVEWMPEYAGKRMDDWLANMGDWCIRASVSGACRCRFTWMRKAAKSKSSAAVPNCANAL